MISLIDVDGVIADFTGGVVRDAEEFLGRPLSARAPHEWDLFSACRETGFLRELTNLQQRECVSRVSSIGWALSIRPYDGAQEAVEKLRKFSDVYFVTSPWISSVSWESDRRSWLKKHFGAPHSEVISTSAKWLISGDLFVDDKPENVDGWNDYNHHNGWGALWDQPYNRHVDHLNRIDSWEMLLFHAESLR